MKREAILFFMENNIINIYFPKSKKELNEKIDTSLFFKYGEISNVEEFSNTIEKLIDNKKIISSIIKPDIIVLYNDITNSDLEYLYKIGLNPLNYNKIIFIKLSELIKDINKNEKIIYYDTNYYTIFKTKNKQSNIDNLEYEPLIIGNNQKDNLHFSKKDIIWQYFKTHFTNYKTYGIM